ncbi:hypothetical protein [Actinoplanes sp. URMC 104]|uniref:hypothetical protein n=1 Tax=Actinoplanes sp. URMC 104 TaxID=3423409 RepID=UPI003F1DB4CD
MAEGTNPPRRLRLHRTDADLLQAAFDLETDRIDAIPLAERTTAQTDYLQQVEALRAKLDGQPGVIMLDGGELHTAAQALMSVLHRLSVSGEASLHETLALRKLLDQVSRRDS